MLKKLRWFPLRLFFADSLTCTLMSLSCAVLPRKTRQCCWRLYSQSKPVSCKAPNYFCREWSGVNVTLTTGWAGYSFLLGSRSLLHIALLYIHFYFGLHVSDVFSEARSRFKGLNTYSTLGVNNNKKYFVTVFFFSLKPWFRNECSKHTRKLTTGANFCDIFFSPRWASLHWIFCE